MLMGTLLLAISSITNAMDCDGSWQGLNSVCHRPQEGPSCQSHALASAIRAAERREGAELGIECSPLLQLQGEPTQLTQELTTSWEQRKSSPTPKSWEVWCQEEAHKRGGYKVTRITGAHDTVMDQVMAALDAKRTLLVYFNMGAKQLAAFNQCARSREMVKDQLRGFADDRSGGAAHMMTIVPDEEVQKQGAVKVKNSWGADMGHEGHLLMDKTAFAGNWRFYDVKTAYEAMSAEEQQAHMNREAEAMDRYMDEEMPRLCKLRLRHAFADHAHGLIEECRNELQCRKVEYEDEIRQNTRSRFLEKHFREYQVPEGAGRGNPRGLVEFEALVRTRIAQLDVELIEVSRQCLEDRDQEARQNEQRRAARRQRWNEACQCIQELLRVEGRSEAADAHARCAAQHYPLRIIHTGPP